jgi:hypothetical protein
MQRSSVGQHALAIQIGNQPARHRLRTMSDFATGEWCHSLAAGAPDTITWSP